MAPIFDVEFFFGATTLPGEQAHLRSAVTHFLDFLEFLEFFFKLEICHSCRNQRADFLHLFLKGPVKKRERKETEPRSSPGNVDMSKIQGADLRNRPRKARASKDLTEIHANRWKPGTL
jgi:hypothetical protein